MHESFFFFFLTLRPVVIWISAQNICNFFGQLLASAFICECECVIQSVCVCVFKRVVPTEKVR